MKLRELQAIYMPLALAMLAEDARCSLSVEDVENVRIGLPSDIRSTHRERVCSKWLQDVEQRLREAQCRDALQTLRNKLHTLSQLYAYKTKNVRHQGANTRARSDISKQEARKQQAVEEYRRARRAKYALSGPGAWETELKVLADDDVRHLTDDDPDTAKKKRKRNLKKDAPDAPAEGRRKVSWIWRGADADGDEGATDSLRVEWAKSRARSKRWKEEKVVVPEEMRRTLATLLYEEAVWTSRMCAWKVADPQLQEGLVAYATSQTNIRRAMQATFRAVCLPTALKAGGGRTVEWLPRPGVPQLSPDAPETPEVPDAPEVPEALEAPDAEERAGIADMHELDGEDLGLSPWA